MLKKIKFFVVWYKFIFVVILLALCFVAYKQIIGSIKYQDTQKEKISLDGDIVEMKLLRSRMRDLIKYIQKNPGLFLKNLDENTILSYGDKMEIWRTWILFSEYVIRLDRIGAKYDYLYKNSEDSEKRQVFVMTFASFLMQYRYAMEFIEAIDKNPTLHDILDEGNEELALEKNTYSDFKFRFLNVARATEFVRLDMIYQFYRKKEKSFAFNIKRDSKWLYKKGSFEGTKDTLANGLRIIQNKLVTVWYPVKEQALLVGTLKVSRFDKHLITYRQINSFKKKLKPGDILLERREWYLSNLGLPGFWTHVAFYVGTNKERDEYFNNDKEVLEWVKSKNKKAKSLNDLIRFKYPKKYKNNSQELENYPINVIEALADGVIFNTIQKSAYADSFAALRPKVSKLEKAEAVFKAFRYVGRPYDYDFDFESDNKLVCSEVIYKSYEGILKLPIVKITGKKVLPPNTLAKMFDEDSNSENQQFDFVLFLDGIESQEKANISDIETFKGSWKRPKWHNIIR